VKTLAFSLIAMDASSAYPGGASAEQTFGAKRRASYCPALRAECLLSAVCSALAPPGIRHLARYDKSRIFRFNNSLSTG